MLLLRRFGSGRRPDRVTPTPASAEIRPPDVTQLRAVVARLNSGSLDVWADMLDFAANADIRDADAVNERAAAWAGRVAAMDLMCR